MSRLFIFFNDTATTEIYTLSLHDALPIYEYFSSISDIWRGQHARHLRALDDAHGVRRPRRPEAVRPPGRGQPGRDRKSTRLNSSHANISYAVFCLKKKILLGGGRGGEGHP